MGSKVSPPFPHLKWEAEQGPVIWNLVWDCGSRVTWAESSSWWDMWLRKGKETNKTPASLAWTTRWTITPLTGTVMEGSLFLFPCSTSLQLSSIFLGKWAFQPSANLPASLSATCSFFKWQSARLYVEIQLPVSLLLLMFPQLYQCSYKASLSAGFYGLAFANSTLPFLSSAFLSRVFPPQCLTIAFQIPPSLMSSRHWPGSLQFLLHRLLPSLPLLFRSQPKHCFLRDHPSK